MLRPHIVHNDVCLHHPWLGFCFCISSATMLLAYHPFPTSTEKLWSPSMMPPRMNMLPPTLFCCKTQNLQILADLEAKLEEVLTTAEADSSRGAARREWADQLLSVMLYAMQSSLVLYIFKFILKNGWPQFFSPYIQYVLTSPDGPFSVSAATEEHLVTNQLAHLVICRCSNICHW